MIKRIAGFTQHYAWGGFNFLPKLLGIDNKEQKPFAELWFGDHTGGNSPITDENEGQMTLRQYIDSDSLSLLGETSCENYAGRLPILLKILDVRKMLSIQAHPSKEAAVIGFMEENKKQIALNAPERVFKDQNPKPEMMVALTPFWLLHGFLPSEKAAENLEKISSLNTYSSIFKTEGIKNGYQRWMELPQEEVDACLKPLKDRLTQLSEIDLNKSSPDYWAKKAFNEFPSKDGHLDRGIFSIYVMNIVHLQPGEAIFQDAGLLHAYLEGINIELMVNSDNVFRGGLTDKYMDIPLLLNHLDFRPTIPNIIIPLEENSKEKRFIIPSKDFELVTYLLKKGEDLQLTPAEGPNLLLCLKGSVSASGLILKAGEAFFIPNKTPVNLLQEGVDEAILYKAGIPQL